jgi:peptidoglycan hydrolase CwlO-like protein
LNKEIDVFVIVRNQIDYKNEVLAVRKTIKSAKARIVEIGKKMVEDAKDIEPLELDIDNETGEVYLTRAEYENEDPLYVLSFVEISDV